MGEMIEIQDIYSSNTFQVEGMDCPDCAAKVKKALVRMPGVISADVVFPAGRLIVNYDNTLTGSEQVINKVRALGYDARDLAAGSGDESQTTSFAVAGMDCADCAAKLEKRISRVAGVESARVNFGASKMIVTHRGATEAILTAIEKMGYTGKVEEGYRKHPQKVSFWRSNPYVMPTLISMFILIIGVIAINLGVSGKITQSLFALGIVLGGFLPARNGLSMLVNSHELDINILMAIAVIGAAFIGQLEEAATVVFLFSLGNTLQGYTLNKTRNSIKALMDLAPNEALVKRNGSELILPVEEIRIGDIIIVRPGERIAMDGKVMKGYSFVNQASITGESIPAEKNAGDEVYAGTINERGSLEVYVTRQAKDNTISRIIKMVEEAQGQRAPSQQFVERFARYYTPAVIILAGLVAIIPPLVFNQPFNKWFYEAMALLLVACPCALVISTPVSIVAAIGSAAQSGVLIKGGAYLEEAGSLSVIAFDKTGTLTIGKPKVTEVLPVNDHSEQELLTIAAAIESRSEHPLGEAILNHAKHKGILIPAVVKFESVPGKGAIGTLDGQTYRIGNARFCRDNGSNLDEIETYITAFENEGKTVMILGDDENILGLIAVADVLRENSRLAVERLKKAGIKKTVMLTGDNRNTAEAIAAQAGIDELYADLLPEDKVEAMQNLLAQDKKVAMVGDGVNDAPAMAISSVGIAMGGAGTDAALETADIALMADDLTKLAYAIGLGRKTLNIIKQNIAFALAIKSLIMLLVIPGWLTLWLAVVGDMGSSLLVTLNGMRLLRFRHQE